MGSRLRDWAMGRGGGMSGDEVVAHAKVVLSADTKPAEVDIKKLLKDTDEWLKKSSEKIAKDTAELAGGIEKNFATGLFRGATTRQGGLLGQLLFGGGAVGAGFWAGNKLMGAIGNMTSGIKNMIMHTKDMESATTALATSWGRVTSSIGAAIGRVTGLAAAIKGISGVLDGVSILMGGKAGDPIVGKGVPRSRMNSERNTMALAMREDKAGEAARNKKAAAFNEMLRSVFGVDIASAENDVSGMAGLARDARVRLSEAKGDALPASQRSWSQWLQSAARGPALAMGMMAPIQGMSGSNSAGLPRQARQLSESAALRAVLGTQEQQSRVEANLERAKLTEGRVRAAADELPARMSQVSGYFSGLGSRAWGLGIGATQGGRKAGGTAANTLVEATNAMVRRDAAARMPGAKDELETLLQRQAQQQDRSRIFSADSYWGEVETSSKKKDPQLEELIDKTEEEIKILGQILQKTGANRQTTAFEDAASIGLGQ